MADVSPKTAARLLQLMVDKLNVLEPWDNAGFVALEQRGHATSVAVYRGNGRLAGSKLWRITPAGLVWLADHR